MSARVLRAALLLGALAVAACNDDGPGRFTATVSAPAGTGALVLEVSGGGIVGFEGMGDVRVFSSPVGPEGSHRVVLVSPSGTALRFAVRVEDVSAEPPRATVLSAVDVENRPVAVASGFSVEVAR